MRAESYPFWNRFWIDLGSIFDGFWDPKSFKFQDKSINTGKIKNSQKHSCVVNKKGLEIQKSNQNLSKTV